MTTYQHQSKNVRNTIFLFLLFTTLTSVIGFGLSYATKSPTWLYLAMIMSVGQGFFGYFFGEKIALATSGGQKITDADNPVLYNQVEDLSRIAGIPMPDLYVSPDQSLNAFACGRGPGRASICVHQGLIDRLTKVEMEGVLAHEISHIKNRDTLTMTMAMVMAGVISAICDFGMKMIMFGGNNDDENSGGRNPAIMILTVLGFMVAPIISTLIMMGVSRSREYLADASAAQITRYPQGLISALEKITASPIPSEHYSTATSHFYIAEPKKEYGEKVNDNWFSTHPAIENRIRALLDQDGTLGK